MELIYDYKNGYVIDGETGEVVDEIYVADPADGFRKSSLESYGERIHYAKMISIPDDRRAREIYIYCRKILSTLNITAVNSDALNKIIRSVLDIYRRYFSNIYVDAVAAAAAYLYMKSVYEKIIPVEDLCIYISNCKHAKFLILRASESIKIDRYNIVAMEILSFSSKTKPEVISTAMALLRHARIDGKKARTAAAVILYIASILLDKDGRDISQNMIAEHFNISTNSLHYRSLEKYIEGLKIYRYSITAPGGAVEKVEIPSHICRDIERIAKLSNKVVCI